MDLIHDHKIWGDEKNSYVPFVWRSHITHSNMDDLITKLMKLLMGFGIKKLFKSVLKLQMENVS